MKTTTETLIFSRLVFSHACEQPESPVGSRSFANNPSAESVSYLLAAGQIHQVEFSTQFLFSLHVFLLDVDQEDAVTARAVLIHVCTKTEATLQSGKEFKKCQLNVLIYIFFIIFTGEVRMIKKL